MTAAVLAILFRIRGALVQILRGGGGGHHNRVKHTKLGLNPAVTIYEDQCSGPSSSLLYLALRNGTDFKEKSCN